MVEGYVGRIELDIGALANLRQLDSQLPRSGFLHAGRPMTFLDQRMFRHRISTTQTFNFGYVTNEGYTHEPEIISVTYRLFFPWHLGMYYGTETVTDKVASELVLIKAEADSMTSEFEETVELAYRFRDGRFVNVGYHVHPYNRLLSYEAAVDMAVGINQSTSDVRNWAKKEIIIQDAIREIATNLIPEMQLREVRAKQRN